jgi:hypothetical protein
VNFFDPLLTSDGKPFGQEKFKEIVQERYLISKHTNTSYADTKDITPTERSLLLNFVVKDLEKQRDLIEKTKTGR